MSAGASSANQGPSLYQTCSAYGRTALDYASDSLRGPDALAGYRTSQLSHSELKRVMLMWQNQKPYFHCCLELATEFVDAFPEDRVVELIETVKTSAAEGPFFWVFPFLVMVNDYFRTAQHCTMFLIEGRNCEFFDSEGRDLTSIPWLEGRSLYDLSALIYNKIQPETPFTYTTPGVACQSDKTSCGFFGLHWVKHRLEGGTTATYLDRIKQLGSWNALTVRAEIAPLIIESYYFCDTYIAQSNHMGYQELRLLIDAIETTTAQCKLIEGDDELASLPCPLSLVIPLCSQHEELTGIILWHNSTLQYYDRDGMRLEERSGAAHQRAKEIHRTLAPPATPFDLDEPLKGEDCLCLVTLLYHLFVKQEGLEEFKAIFTDSDKYQRLKIDAFLYFEAYGIQRGYLTSEIDSSDDF